MFYKYDRRVGELARILKIPYDTVKERALRQFIEAEKKILGSLDVPTSRSQVLDLAETKLREIENPTHNQLHFPAARTLF